MQISALLSILSLAFLVSSCAFREDSEQYRAQKGKDELMQGLESATMISPNDIKVEYFPIENQPRAYRVRLSWPSGKSLFANVYLNGKALGESADVSKTSYLETECNGGDLKFSIDFYLKQLSKASLHIEKNETCPRDEIVESRQHLSAIETKKLNGRLFMKNGSTLYLENNPLLLEVRELIVEGDATIQAFSENRNPDQLKVDEWVAAAPDVRIRAKKATGHLNFVLHGIDGRDDANQNYNGTVAPAPAKAPKGADGEVQIRSAARSKMGIESGDGPRCVKQAGNGQPGAPGKINGVPGAPGLPGSATAAVLLNIEDASKFRADIFLSPGRGGLGPLGSMGQPGGEGGEPGTAPEPCVAASKGPPGPKLSIDGQRVRGPVGKCGAISLSSSLKGLVNVQLKEPVSNALEVDCTKSPGLVSYF